jgi:hypothetical protein
MSRLVDRRPVVAPPAVRVLRILGAALLVAMGAIHLYLWSTGFKNIPVIGPSFMLNAIAGVVLALGVIVVWIRDTRREIDELPVDHH